MPPSISRYLDAPKCHTVKGKVIQSASFSLTLLHPTDPGDSITRSTSHEFCHEECDWGYASFCEIAKLRNGGFIEDPGGKVTFVVEGNSCIKSFADLNATVPLPINAAAAMLSPLYASGLWYDVQLTAESVKTGERLAGPTRSPGGNLLPLTGAGSELLTSSGNNASTLSTAGEQRTSPAATPPPALQRPSSADMVACSSAASIPCHAAVIAACTPVFWAMLSGQWQEGKQRHITLYGVEHEVLDLCIRWVYGQDVVVPVTQLIPLWVLGDQYNIKGLCGAVEGCITSLLDTQPQLALQLYTATRQSTPQASRISQVVLEAVERHLPLCASQAQFIHLSWQHVSHVLAVSWDRFKDTGFESAWQVPHDMLTVLTGVYTWLQAHARVPTACCISDSTTGNCAGQSHEQSAQIITPSDEQGGHSSQEERQLMLTPRQARKCVAQLVQIIDLSGLSHRYAQYIQDHPLVLTAALLASKVTIQQAPIHIAPQESTALPAAAANCPALEAGSDVVGFGMDGQPDPFGEDSIEHLASKLWMIASLSKQTSRQRHMRGHGAFQSALASQNGPSTSQSLPDLSQQLACKEAEYENSCSEDEGVWNGLQEVVGRPCSAGSTGTVLTMPGPSSPAENGFSTSPEISCRQATTIAQQGADSVRFGCGSSHQDLLAFESQANVAQSPEQAQQSVVTVEASQLSDVTSVEQTYIGFPRAASHSNMSQTQTTDTLPTSMQRVSSRHSICSLAASQRRSPIPAAPSLSPNLAKQIVRTRHSTNDRTVTVLQAGLASRPCIVSSLSIISSPLARSACSPSMPSSAWPCSRPVTRSVPHKNDTSISPLHVRQMPVSNDTSNAKTSRKQPITKQDAISSRYQPVATSTHLARQSARNVIAQDGRPPVCSPLQRDACMQGPTLEQVASPTWYRPLPRR